MTRARARIGSGAATAPAGLAAAARPAGAPLTRIVVRDGSRVVVVPAAELDWVEAAGD